jgi:hypothetical protein
VQSPRIHTAFPNAHALPQLPQLLTSFDKFAHVLPQLV